MGFILFKKKFAPAILDGSKTTTLRSWKRHMVKPGEVASSNLGIKLSIKSVEKISANAITDAHARADGFSDRAALISELRAIYPELPATLTLVTFSVASNNIA